MQGRPQLDYSNTELDQELLTLPFKVNTNWYVITGAPCSGKTTLIDNLADLGYNTVPEAGRKYIENELAKGRSLDEVRQDPANFTRKIYALMIEHESSLQPDQVYQ